MNIVQVKVVVVIEIKSVYIFGEIVVIVKSLVNKMNLYNCSVILNGASIHVQQSDYETDINQPQTSILIIPFSIALKCTITHNTSQLFTLSDTIKHI